MSQSNSGQTPPPAPLQPSQITSSSSLSAATIPLSSSSPTQPLESSSTSAAAAAVATTTSSSQLPLSSWKIPRPSLFSQPAVRGASASQSSAVVSPAPGPSSLPEAVWLPFIQQVYPDRHKKTYFLPPVQFNRQHYTVKNVAGESVAVMQEHPQQPHGPPPPPPPTPARPQVAGSVFTSNPPGLQPSRHQDSDVQDDQAQHYTLQCLRALSDQAPQAMVVVSQLLFRQYLDNVTNPLDAAAAAALPTVQQLSQQLGDGECDVLIIHKKKGVIVGEIKSVGAGAYFTSQPESQRQQIIARKVTAAVKQLNNQGQVLGHLVGDLKVRVTKTLILPYVSAAQLFQAVHGTQTAQDLCQCVGAIDLQEAVDRCLCGDRMPGTEYLHSSHTPVPQSLWSRLRDALRHRSKHVSGQHALGQLARWWHRLGGDGNMRRTLYDRLLARFYGPATTVDVYTPTRPRLQIRTEAEAVAETGLRFSRLALTPDQVSLLSLPDHDDSGRGFLYLHAPPGCGKTVLLYLKAKQWLNMGRHVHVVCISDRARAVSSLLAAQLLQSQGAAAAVTTHTFDFINNPGDVSLAVGTLVSLAVPGVPLYIIVDEADSGDSALSSPFEDLCRDLHLAVPNTCLWSAGVTRLSSPPACVRVVDTLTTALRCPPAVQREVNKSVIIDGSDVPHYSRQPWPAPTDGPAVRWLKHHAQPGHDGGDPDHCEQCGRHVGHLLHDLGVGQSELQWRDIFVLVPDPSRADPLVRGLKQAAVPVAVVNRRTATAGDWEDLALARTDRVTVTHYDCVRGLERRVVVGVGEGGLDRLQAMSRCTGLLVWEGTPDDY